jgi:hypothetical protein
MAQLLAAPVLEVPLAGALDELDVSEDVVVLVLGAAAPESAFDLLSVAPDGLLSVALSAAFLAPPLLLYRSAYQPPPLRMKPAPPDT